MESQVELKCENCGKIFTRRLAEANRNKKRKQRVCCGRKCQGKILLDNIPLNKRFHPENLVIKTSNKYTPFRWYIKCIKQRHKDTGKEYNIDLEYLKNLWEKQNGICPITGWQLTLRIHQQKQDRLLTNIASLDRIDCKKGYIKGNVRFVSVMANFARNCFSDEELIDFCKAVADYRK